jgi:3-methyladenine DNA glycosylase/8-oxoguanine DNA glycosylase
VFRGIDPELFHVARLAAGRAGDGMMKFDLPARKPFNFQSVVDSHGWRQLAPFLYDESSSTLSYTDRLSTDRVIEYRISASSDGLHVETDRLVKAERREVEDRIAWMFGLDMDFSAFHAASRLEPKLARAKKLALGRVLRSPTLFEDVIKTILTTNTLWAATRNMVKRLVEEFGTPLSSTGQAVNTSARVDKNTGKQNTQDAVQNSRAFPAPETIAASNPKYIKDKIRVGYRAPAIHDLAVRVASGNYDLEALKPSSLPTLELRKELMSIKGVGPYAAANLLMLLGRHDFIPIDSYALMMVSHEWYRGKPVTAKHVEKRFAKWGEFKGLAFWFWDWKYNQ